MTRGPAERSAAGGGAPLSLRMRLILIILTPLLAIAGAIGVWQTQNARATAQQVFERSLLSAALAVTNDVALSSGDALAPRTRALLADTSGGMVFYHVYAPDGVIVAGYATPPVGIPQGAAAEGGPRYFEARYRGRAVSGVRLQTRTQIDGFSGVFTTTVWQDNAVRDAFVRDLQHRALVGIAGLILCVALVVWFGVRYGLRPLVDLEDAIQLRSSDALTPIRRPVPAEVQGVVGTLNRLFGQVSGSLTAQSEFISNAAHQLRNPIAGVLSLAEAVRRAPDHGAAMDRAEDLLAAARESAELAQKLLTLERAKALSPLSLHRRIDVAAALRDWGPALIAGAETAPRPVTITLAPPPPEPPATVIGDATLLREALVNLIDNALRHGGPGLTRIAVSAKIVEGAVALTVRDDGAGVAEADIPKALARFSQLSAGAGSGLGLPIVESIAEGHGGTLRLAPNAPGLEATLTIPLAADPSA